MYKKPVTLKDVARSAGYSLRTVKKVFGQEPGVRVETREKILLAASELGYEKNMMASALATGRVYHIAVVMGDYRHFFPKAREGFEQCSRDIRDFKFGIGFYTPADRTLGAAQALLSRLLHDEQVDAVIMHASKMHDLNEQIDALTAAGKPVITFGSDAPASRRLCFVGPKAFESGRIAAQVMSFCIGGQGNVYIVNRDMSEMQTAERNRGFMAFISEHSPGIRVHQLSVPQCEEDYMQAIRAVLDAQSVDGFVGTDADSYLIGNVLEEQKKRDVSVIGFDLTADSQRLLYSGYFKAVLGQNPELQAYRALQVMCAYLARDVRPERNIHTSISILTSECLHYERG